MGQVDARLTAHASQSCDGEPTWSADDVLVAHRVGRRLGLIELDGRVLARERGTSRVRITQGPHAGAEAKRHVVDLARLSDDEVHPLLDGALGVALDLAIMRQRPEVRAIAVGSPRTAMALGSVHRPILALTHTGAEIALEGAAWLDPAAYLGLPADVDETASSIGSAGYVHIPGIALLALGSEPLDALRRLDVLETLARMTVAATESAAEPITVTPRQAAAVPAQRPAEPRPSRDFRRYYRSLDRLPAAHPSIPEAVREPLDAVKADVALACRMLAAAGDLVAFFEHVSHRVPGDDDRFAMSPAKDFGDMRPDDVGILATEGDCQQLDGHIPPAPFRWYHRDILRARPDVNAIVHTHELLGRAYIMAGTTPPVVHRYGVLGMRDQGPPTFPTPSLLFDPADRAEMLTLLGEGPWVHSLAHGTDYCAPDIASATVAAIHREQHLRFHALAHRLGEPDVLDHDVLDGLAASGPTAQQWWDAYADELGE